MTYNNSNSNPEPEALSAYRVHRSMTSRWSDNDVYGHINNAVYFHWFDAVLNAFLIEEGLLDVQRPTVIGLMVQTHCNYFSSLSYPQLIQIGMRVARIGNSSVRYELAAFGDVEVCAAKGHLIHVYVDPVSRRPVTLPAKWREVLETLQ